MDFDENSCAYITTNENVRRATAFMPKDCQRALTVAASGAHPLCCFLYGAEHVDTFDITSVAKLIMDIKTSAIQCLDHYDYIELLENLWLRNDALNVPNMNIVSENLSVEEIKYLESMRGHRLFGQDKWYGRDSENLPTRKEYKQLQEIVKAPFDFVQTDIVGLSANLTGNYKFMNLSNILDHIDVEEHWDIVGPLLEHVDVGGRIVSYQLCISRPEHFSKNSKTSEKILENWRRERHRVRGICHEDYVTVLERVR